MSLAAIVQPLLFAAFLWWFSTGAILWLDRRPRETFGWSLACAGVIAIAAGVVVGLTASRTDVAAAYLGFIAAIAIWGWHEMSFLMGFITGPRRVPLPEGVTGWKRFKLAAATVIHHELALAVTALALFALTWGAPNQIAAQTFALLWLLRLSAKLNLFLGAPYRGEEMLPAHLSHLGSYFGRRTMNALFPLSLLGGAALIYAIAAASFAPTAPPSTQTGAVLMLTLAALGLVEHIFMFVPPPNALLWGWATRRTQQRRGG